jgi:hypothetical protein
MDTNNFSLSRTVSVACVVIKLGESGCTGILMQMNGLSLLGDVRELRSLLLAGRLGRLIIRRGM